MILQKLRESFGIDENWDAFTRYKEFESKKREASEDLLNFLN